MQREKDSASILPLSLCSLSLLFLTSFSTESLTSEIEPNAGTTLADMVRQVERRATKADEIAEPVVPQPKRRDPMVRFAEPRDVNSPGVSPPATVSLAVADRHPQEPQQPISFLSRLSEIVTGLQGDMNEAMTATMTATLGEYLADPAPVGAAAEELSREPSAVASVDQSQAEQQGAEVAPEFVAVAPAPIGTVALSDLFRPLQPLTDEAGGSRVIDQTADPAGSEPVLTLEPPKPVPQGQATGLSLAEMASHARPDKPQQSRDVGQASTYSLSQLAAVSARVAPVPRLPSSLTQKRWIGAQPARALRFPEPRRVEQAPVGGAEALKYPASASLARFLGGVDSLPRNLSGARGGAVPVVLVNLGQVRRKIESDRRAPGSADGTAGRYRVTGFSFPKEAFAGNRMTQQGRSQGRRLKVMRELRQVFSPLQ